jgi:hypothetical protein
LKTNLERENPYYSMIPPAGRERMVRRIQALEQATVVYSDGREESFSDFLRPREGLMSIKITGSYLYSPEPHDLDMVFGWENESGSVGISEVKFSKGTELEKIKVEMHHCEQLAPKWEEYGDTQKSRLYFFSGFTVYGKSFRPDEINPHIFSSFVIKEIGNLVDDAMKYAPGDPKTVQRIYHIFAILQSAGIPRNGALESLFDLYRSMFEHLYFEVDKGPLRKTDQAKRELENLGGVFMNTYAAAYLISQLFSQIHLMEREDLIDVISLFMTQAAYGNFYAATVLIKIKEDKKIPSGCWAKAENKCGSKFTLAAPAPDMEMSEVLLFRKFADELEQQRQLKNMDLLARKLRRDRQSAAKKFSIASA